MELFTISWPASYSFTSSKANTGYERATEATLPDAVGGRGVASRHGQDKGDCGGEIQHG